MAEGPLVTGRRRHLSSCVALLLLLCTVLASCSSGSTASGSAGATGSADKTRIIAISFPGANTNELVKAGLAQVTASAKSQGYKVVVADPGSSLNEQVTTLTTWIQQRVSVLVVQPIAPESLEATAGKAIQSGIPWVTYGVNMKNQTSFFGFDHKSMSDDLVGLLTDWNKKNSSPKLKVALLTYNTVEWARKRESAMNTALATDLPGATVVARQNALSESDGLKAMSTILQAHPDVNAVLAVEETASVGAYQALLNAGRKSSDPSLFVGGMDGSQTAFKLLQKSTFYRASIAVDTSNFGPSLAGAAIDAANGSKKDVLLPPVPLAAGSPKIATFITK